MFPEALNGPAVRSSGGSSTTMSGLFRSRSVTNAAQSIQLDQACGKTSTVDAGSGLESRFNLSGRGYDILDTLFGHGWSLDGNTGIISVSDAAFLRVTNSDPLEKWYILDSEPIARGQFAAVYRCQHRVSGLEYAAKFASRRRHGTDASRDIKHEVAVGAMLASCHRTVGLRDVFATDTHIVLLMEYAPGGDLQTVLDEDLVPYERDVIGFLRQLLHSLAHIHDLGLVHLDIKPQNLVLMGEFPDCAVKLCDFEISRVISPQHEVREILGTPDYVAPEIIHYEPITTKTDMWSLGVLTYVLLSGFLPFGGDTDQETFLEISRGLLDFPEELFEDISGHAINFIQRLLVRCPSQRMSALECLEHPWIKTELKKSQTPSMTIPLTATNQIMQLPGVESSAPKSLTMPNTPTANWNILDDWAKLTANYTSNNNGNMMHTNNPSTSVPIPSGISMTPNSMTPICMTPTLMTPVPSSPRETIHFPVYRPYISYRTNASVHSSTHSLYRGGSRQNIDKLKSQSKSREVLVERLQMSSQKKNVSRSRERLFDGHYALSKSREYLLSNRSFSHSVEELSPYDFLNNEDYIYKSMNNVYMQQILPEMDEESFSNKLYKRLASVEKIYEVDIESQNSFPRTPFLDARQPVNSMTDDEYNNYLSRFYPVVRSKTEEPQKQLNRTTYQGGRNSQPCDRHCSREVQQHYTPRQPVVNRNKPENSCYKKNHQRIQKDHEPSKKDKKKIQRDKPKNKSETLEKPERKSTRLQRQNSTVERRSGSVSHIEQRIKERHERMIERNEKQKTAEKKQQRNVSTKEKQRRHSEENDKSNHLKENKEKSVNSLTSRRNSFPARKQPSMIKAKNESRNTTPASSIESVKEGKKIFESSVKTTGSVYNKKEPHQVQSKKEEIQRNAPNDSNQLKEHKFCKPTLSASEFKHPPMSEPRMSGATNFNSEKNLESMLCRNSPENGGDIDEAYVSLEEPVDDGIFSRSESMDSSTTVDSDSTLHAGSSSSDTLDTTLQELLMSDTETIPFINKKIGNNVEDVFFCNSNNKNLNVPSRSCSKSSEKLNEHLTIIQENDDDERKSKTFTRSVSTSSDIGSMLSESSDLAPEEFHRKISMTSDHNFEPKSRIRSNSVQVPSAAQSMPFKLSRSNSVHLDTPLSGVARPWGEVCQGSVYRALTMFRQHSSESSSSGSSTSSRRRSSNWSTAEGLDQIIEKIRADDEEKIHDIVVAPLFKISDFSQPINPQIPNPPPLPSNNKNTEKSNFSTIVNSLSTLPSTTQKFVSPELTTSSFCQPHSSTAHNPKMPIRPSSIPIRTRF